ncbi:MAG TPA: circadian clock KaiB family protein [Gemmatimonadaceae bacterium]|nr:circadian clock KaiB family protein [Gemmatimonadaceae bacterium]
MRFTLYVAGAEAPRARQAVANLRRLGEQRLLGRFALRVVDVVADPASAERERILTTPTLVKESPEPVRRLTGDLGDADRVLLFLALPPHLYDAAG